MIDFLKNRKIFIIIGGLIIFFIGWKLYNRTESFNVEEAIISEKNIINENSTEEAEEMVVIQLIFNKQEGNYYFLMKLGH